MKNTINIYIGKNSEELRSYLISIYHKLNEDINYCHSFYDEYWMVHDEFYGEVETGACIFMPEYRLYPSAYISFAYMVSGMEENKNLEWHIATYSQQLINLLIEEEKEKWKKSRIKIHILKNGEINNTLSIEEVKEIYTHGVDLFLNIEDYFK